jgi:hypothetical protein
MGIDSSRPRPKHRRLLLTGLLFCLANPAQAQTLPPPDDIPEEVLRTEIILEGRSPVDGRALTATEYTELMEQLAQNPNPPQLNSEVQHLIFLLRVRKMIKTLIPFI